MSRSTSPPPPFPYYLIPNFFTNRRRRSSTSPTTAVSLSPTSPSTSPPTRPTSYITSTPTSHLRCTKCLADLIPVSNIISKGFNGRHGRAYLVSASPPSAIGLPASGSDVVEGDLPNTTTHKPVPRQLVTGAHTVSDISCRVCKSVLGWKYVAAEEESQKYKVGKFILETNRVVKEVGWDGDHDFDPGMGMGTGMPVLEDVEVEFDSQDDEECEDLFSGLWSPELARARRRTRVRHDGSAD